MPSNCSTLPITQPPPWKHDDDRQVRVGRRPVHAHGHAVGVAILDREHRLRLAARHREDRPQPVARHLRRARSRRHLDPGRVHEVADRLRLRVQRHVRPSRTRRAARRPRRPTGPWPGGRNVVHPEEAVEEPVGAHDLASARPRRAGAAPYASPWSRSGSYSAVMTTARAQGRRGRARAAARCASRRSRRACARSGRRTSACLSASRK